MGGANSSSSTSREVSYSSHEEDYCKKCKSYNCLCPLCHGNPKRYLGPIHAGIHNSDGSVTCRNCGRTNNKL